MIAIDFGNAEITDLNNVVIPFDVGEVSDRHIKHLKVLIPLSIRPGEPMTIRSPNKGNLSSFVLETKMSAVGLSHSPFTGEFNPFLADLDVRGGFQERSFPNVSEVITRTIVNGTVASHDNGGLTVSVSEGEVSSVDVTESPSSYLEEPISSLRIVATAVSVALRDEGVTSFDAIGWYVESLLPIKFPPSSITPVG